MSRTTRTPTEKFHRNPRTLNEVKAGYSAKEDEVRVRPKRNKRNLPNSYDDIPIAARKEFVEPDKKILDQSRYFCTVYDC